MFPKDLFAERKVYFAHPVSDYDTTFEARCLEAIGQSLSTTILNPNLPYHAEQYRKLGMYYFESLCAECDTCVFVRFPDGSLGRGVATEIQTFFRRGLPVFELPHRPGDKYLRRFSLPSPALSVEDTRAAVSRFRSEPCGGRADMVTYLDDLAAQGAMEDLLQAQARS